MVEYDNRIRDKLESEYYKKQQNAKDVQDQLEKFKEKYIANMKAEMMEGELIKRQVEEELEREKMRELERAKKNAQNREEFKKANRELLDIQAQIALKEKEEEKRIEEYSKKKDALEHLKKTKLAENFAQK